MMTNEQKTIDALWVRRLELDGIAAKLRRTGGAEYAQLLGEEAQKLGMVLMQIEGILQDAAQQGAQ